MEMPRKEVVEKFYVGDSLTDKELEALQFLFKTLHDSMVLAGYTRLSTVPILNYQLRCEDYIRARKEK